MRDLTNRRITLFHVIIVCLAYVTGDRFARLLNAYLLPSPIDWLPIAFGVLGVLLLTKPALFFLRFLLVRLRRAFAPRNSRAGSSPSH